MKVKPLNLTALIAALESCRDSEEKSKPCYACAYVNCPSGTVSGKRIYTAICSWNSRNKCEGEKEIMPVIFLLGFFALFGIASAASENHNPNTASDTTEMLKQMTGKSKRECRRIARQYGRR